jgi:hypothetical protein
VLYGPQPGLAKQAFLIDEYKSLKADANRSEAEQQYLRQQFLDRLKEEEENFQTLRKPYPYNAAAGGTARRGYVAGRARAPGV